MAETLSEETKAKLRKIQRGRWDPDTPQGQELRRKMRLAAKDKKKPRLQHGLPPKEKIKRLCLNCDKKFMAEGRFNRICNQCKQTEAWHEGAGVLSLEESWREAMALRGKRRYRNRKL